MSLSRASATKNMWMERGGHIGALVGGIAGKLFGWVPRFLIGLFKWTFMEYGWVMFAFVGVVIYGFMAMMHGLDHRFEPATPEEITAELAKPHRECLAEYLPRLVGEKKGESLTYGGLGRAQEACEESEKQTIALEKQKNLLGVKK